MSFDLICFSHLRWDFVYQRPQHLLSRCARERRVFFVEEPLFDVDCPRMEITRREDGLHIVVPHLPSELRERAAQAMQRDLVDRLLAEQHISDYVLWYYTPMAMPFTRHLEPLAIVYDCMDELSAFKHAPVLLRERETELFVRADLVFTGGHSLYEAKRDQHPHVYAFPSSIDAPHFAHARSTTEGPSDQADIPHPRLGFYGVIDERMDLDLIAGVADLRPSWHLVLLGPVVKIDPNTLPRRDNIHYLGKKSYSELPSYLAGWDVALLPFICNEHTRFISPTKTPEYLAGGKPVVSTPIRDVVTPYGENNLVAIAETPESFVAAAESYLQVGFSETRIQAIDTFLADTSWDSTWQQMRQLIQRAIEARPDPEARITLASAVDATDADNSVPASARATSTLRRHYSGNLRPFDYLIVGAGFAGSVLAERLASQDDKRVLLIDRRHHIGGNAYDIYDDAGIQIHSYGPHIFHTNSQVVYEYLSQFTAWRSYQHRVLASVDGQLVPLPINLDTINSLYGLNLSCPQLNEFYASVAEPRATVRTSEDVVVSKVGRELYEKFFRNYTRKQWGRDPSELDATVTARVPVRTNRDDRYFTDTYQVMPLHGYTRLFERMLRHSNIKVMLNTDYRDVANLVPYEQLIYTGPIDEYFDYRFGKLPYRSLEFRFETVHAPVHQPVAVVNYPNEYAYTRVTEFKYLTGQEHPKTTLVYEYPRAEGDPYYPVPCPENAALYKQYKALADATPDVYFVGRLATYKYYNMDQVVAQALATFARIHGKQSTGTAGDQVA